MDIDQNEIVRIQQKASATLHLIADGHQFYHRQPDGAQHNYTLELKTDLAKVVNLTTQLSANLGAKNA